MTEFSDALKTAASGMQAQAMRLRYTSENISNADTPGYRRKLMSFEAEMNRGQASGGVVAGAMKLDHSTLPRIHDPSHPMADEAGYFDGSNVDLVMEIADAREAQRSYEANLKMFDQVRKMSSSLMDLLKK
ncbi:flagellar basal body rod protein FlgC [Aestuariibius insulae]|uniref:flagellar basal body rod protein FlgC n=1 Tax=Aestuariibius insulae TaxID=2058287 RepID=UPI00345F0BCB